MPWYKGPTLLEVFDSIIPPKRKQKYPLRFSVLEVTKSANGLVVSGRVIAGTLKKGMIIACGPLQVKSKVASIELN